MPIGMARKTRRRQSQTKLNNQQDPEATAFTSADQPDPGRRQVVRASSFAIGDGRANAIFVDDLIGIIINIAVVAALLMSIHGASMLANSVEEWDVWDMKLCARVSENFRKAISYKLKQENFSTLVDFGPGNQIQLDLDNFTCPSARPSSPFDYSTSSSGMDKEGLACFTFLSVFPTSSFRQWQLTPLGAKDCPAGGTFSCTDCPGGTPRLANVGSSTTQSLVSIVTFVGFLLIVFGSLVLYMAVVFSDMREEEQDDEATLVSSHLFQKFINPLLYLLFFMLVACTVGLGVVLSELYLVKYPWSLNYAESAQVGWFQFGIPVLCLIAVYTAATTLICGRRQSWYVKRIEAREREEDRSEVRSEEVELHQVDS